MMTTPASRASALFLVGAVLASCSPYQEVELHEVTRVEVLGLSNQHLALRLDARVENPNGFRIHVEEPEVDLFLNDRFVGKAVLDSALVLDRRRTAVYPVYLHADLQEGSLFAVLLTGALQGEMRLGAKGTVAGRSGALRKRFPFEWQQVVRLRE
ncbi:MAG TPA: hypothetical protein DIT64_06025 [Verrucomicrobiales bacterium]|jgi:LEA14-like dessication related protein|nr:hypothetical protein [Verrucomicrobiales bacterium]